jgi:cysteinyl-tRNA synthetase
MGLLPRVFASNLAPSSVERLGNLLKSEQNSFRLRLNPGLLFGRILSGGGTPLEEIEDKLSSENKQVWSLLKTHYQGLRYQLKKHKKEIAKVDVEKIEELFNQLQKAEVKLMKVIVMTEKYKRLLEIHGEQDASTVLRIEHIKRFVDERNRYFDRVVKKQDVLLDIIKSIALQVQKDAPTQVSSAVASVASETRKFKGAPLKIDDLLG